MSKRSKGMAVSALLLVIGALFQKDALLPNGGMRALLVLMAALSLWVTEAMPMSISTIFMICASALLGLMSFSEAVTNISTNTMLFIMASSGITVAIADSHIPAILTAIIVKKTADRTKSMLLLMSILVALCSAFMSSLATCTLFNCLVLSLLNHANIRPGKSNLGKDLMIAIPACAGIGGFMSPAGTPANVLLLDILAREGIEVSFVKWCKIGFPIGLFTVILFTVMLLVFFPPEKISLPQIVINTKVKWDFKDTKCAIIISAVVIGWFLSSWIPSINITMIAIIGLTAMFIPRIQLLEWEEFSKGINWDLVLTMGTVSVLMTGLSQSGLTEFITSGVVNKLAVLPQFLVFAFLSLIICALRAFIPTTTAVVALIGPMLIDIAKKLGFDMSILFMILAFWTASALLLVFTEPIYLITYSNKYYKASDLFRVGLLPSIVMAVVLAVLVPNLT